MSELRRKLFFTAGLARVLIEVTLLGAILLILLPGAIEQPPADDLSLEGFIITVCCGLWGALRFRRDTRSVTKYLAALAIGVSVIVGMLAMILLFGKMTPKQADLLFLRLRPKCGLPVPRSSSHLPGPQ